MPNKHFLTFRGRTVVIKLCVFFTVLQGHTSSFRVTNPREESLIDGTDQTVALLVQIEKRSTFLWEVFDATSHKHIFPCSSRTLELQALHCTPFLCVQQLIVLGHWSLKRRFPSKLQFFKDKKLWNIHTDESTVVKIAK